jgi:glucose-1-phosphate adenylyltransferase
VLILSGDQLYRMDFRQLLQTHLEARADVTIAVLPVDRSQVAGFGIMQLNDSGRVVGFVEKPKTEQQLQPLRTPDDWLARRGILTRGRNYLASMGIYLFDRQALLDLLAAEPPAVDFGKEIFPRSIRTHHVQAHLFDGYWEDLGTVKSYHEANLALASNHPPFDFHSPEGVIYTHMRYLPASRVCSAHLEECLIGDGCVVDSGTRIKRSVVGVRSRIGQNVTIQDTVIIGADIFETDAERAANRERGIPDLGVGDGTVIERAILDKNCRIGRSVQIVNRGNVQEADGKTHVIREGVVVIPKGVTIPDGTVI